MCMKPAIPTSVFMSEIDGSRLAMPGYHPVPHMLAAMFFHPAQLEADTEMWHLNTNCPVTLSLCHTHANMSSLFHECVSHVTFDLVHPAALHTLLLMSFDVDRFLGKKMLD